MTPFTSLDTLTRNPEYLVELEQEQLRKSHPIECHEASYSLWRTPSKAGSGAHGTQTEQWTEVQHPLSRIEELNRDRFLRFRDEWVRNRARDIQLAGSISFRTCSEDTASITALNEFYSWRIFDGFKAEYRGQTEVEIGEIQGSRDFGSFRKDVEAPEKLHKCRSTCSEKAGRVFKRACHRGAKSRV